METFVVITDPTLGAVEQSETIKPNRDLRVRVPGGVIGSVGGKSISSVYLSEYPIGKQGPPHVPQTPILGGVFGSAGASVTGTFHRPYDPIPDPDSRSWLRKLFGF